MRIEVHEEVIKLSVEEIEADGGVVRKRKRIRAFTFHLKPTFGEELDFFEYLVSSPGEIRWGMAGFGSIGLCRDAQGFVEAVVKTGDAPEKKRQFLQYQADCKVENNFVIGVGASVAEQVSVEEPLQVNLPSEKECAIEILYESFLVLSKAYQKSPLFPKAPTKTNFGFSENGHISLNKLYTLSKENISELCEQIVSPL